MKSKAAYQSHFPMSLPQPFVERRFGLRLSNIDRLARESRPAPANPRWSPQ